MEERAIRPPEIPNDNTPGEAAPGTVGPTTATPGDPHGIVVTDGPASPPPIPVARPAAWSGWPAEWGTSWNGQLDMLADTAWACLDLNSRVFGSMPPYLVGAAPTLDANWMHNPDPDKYASWADFAKSLFWDYQLGEAFVLATARYATGWPARFHVVEPWAVNVDMDGARRRYTIGTTDVTGDMLHIRYTTRTGCARGQGPLDAGRARLVAAEVMSRDVSNLVGSGGVPPSVLEHPDELSAEQATNLQEQWIAARMSSVGFPAVLSGGVTWKPTSVNPADMALTELVQMNDARIAVLLGVPPYLMNLPSGGNSMTYSNVASLFDYHWRSALRPFSDAICSAVSAWALPAGTTFEVNRDEYVRPDPYTRAQTYQLLISSGILAPEEARALERFGIGAPVTVPITAPAPVVAPVEGAPV